MSDNKISKKEKKKHEYSIMALVTKNVLNNNKILIFYSK